MKPLRVLSAAAAALTVAGVAGAVSSPVDAATPRPAAPSSARAYQTSHGVKITWADPHSSYDSLAVRYRRGTAPTRTQGKNVPVGKHATSAALTGLKPGAAYAVSIWTRKGSAAKAVYSARTTVTFIAPRKPAATTVGNGTLKGVVKDRTGRPLERVVIYAFSETSKSGRRLVTGASGTYTAALPAGLYDVFIDASRAKGGSSDATGYQTDDITARVRAKTTTTRNLTLRDGGAITGRVLDRSGKPLRDIVVFTQTVQPVAPTDEQDGAVFGGGGLTYTVTNADGTYRLKGVSADAAQLCFDSENIVTGAPGRYLGTCRDQAVAVAATTTKDAGDTTLQPTPSTTPTSGGGTLKIAVTTSTGKQVDRADIFVLGRTGNSGYDLEATADSHGRAVLTDLPTSTVEACAQATSESTKATAASGFRPVCKTAHVVSKKTTSVSIVLPLGAAVSGTVVGPRGAQPNVSIDLESSSDGSPFDARQEVAIAGEGFSTNSVGRYKVTSLPAGRYRVCAEAGDVQASAPTGTLPACRAKQEALTAGGIRILDLAVKTASAVKGTVLAADGTAPKGALVGVGTGRTGQLVSSGRYDVGGLKAGSHRMCAEAFYVVSGVYAEACRTVVTTIAHTSTLNLTLPAAGTVVASASYNGQPVTGADAVLIKACPHNDGGSLGYGCGPFDAFSPTTNVTEVASANTLANGAISLDGVPPGDYALCMLGFNAATAGADLPESGVYDTCTSGFDVHVTKGATTTQALTLSQAAGVTGKVTGPGNKPIAGVRVDVSGEAVTPDNEDDDSDSPSSDYAITAADGTYTVRSIKPGAQTVCFDASQAGTAKSGYQDQCVGGQPGGTGDGTPQLLLPGMGNTINQTLQSGPGRNGNAVKHPATHRSPHAAAAASFVRTGALARLSPRLNSVHDAQSATAWWRTAGTRFAALPAILRSTLFR